MVFSDNFTAWIPILGVYVYAGNRLLPTTQNLFQDVANVRAHQAVVELMFDHLQTNERPLPAERAPQLKPLPFDREIRLQDLRFRYPGTVAGGGPRFD